jgi:hypothetical protein
MPTKTKNRYSKPKGATSCCPPPADASPCCSPGETVSESCCPEKSSERPGYKVWPFVCDWLDSPVGRVPQIATRLVFADIIGRWQMRWGLGRMRYRIAPGLYAIGKPTGLSPVLVTANYKMTFDIVRRDMHGQDAWLLVLDTRGINVWCAAGKGTFSTAELVRQVRSSNLLQLVEHRTLILPQLGAPGVAAHKVKKACGFNVVFGPICSSDLPEFLNNGLLATPEMRRVSFKLLDRLVLTPVELVNMRKQVFWSMLVLFFLGGIGPHVFSLAAAWDRGGAAIMAGILGTLTGAVIVPILLPWLPGPQFALKGAAAGLAIGFLNVLFFMGTLDWLDSMALLISVAAVSSWCAMHFTGSTTFTSPSGVEKEMRQAIPVQLAALVIGGICWFAGAF